MYYDQAMKELRENLNEKGVYLLFENDKMKIEVFPETNEKNEIERLKYNILKGEEVDANDTIGYIDIFPTDMLLTDSWTLIK